MEANGANEFVTGYPKVDAALKRLREKNYARFQDLEDSVLVQAHLEKQMSKRLKEHAEFIRTQEQAEVRHKERMAEFEDKLNALISFLDNSIRRPQ